uniref:Uncharacterized protein n=1 Tax=Arundo donax TaxID=35708 RepID=A0A0A9BRU8_ARUDO
MPEKGFRLALILQLSESTDIVGIAMKCLQSLASRFKLVTESAMGELIILASLQDIFHSHAPPLVAIQQPSIRHSEVLTQIQYVAKQMGRDLVLAILTRQSYHTYFQSQLCIPVSKLYFRTRAQLA